MKLRNATDDGWEAISGGSGFTDHGVLLGLGDDDHPQYHNDARGDARYTLIGHDHVENDITDLQDYLTEAAADLLYAPISHGHAIGEITGFDPADYLLLAGGVMTGNIDFSDLQEGIRLWDQDAAYFNAFFMDSLEFEICIGDNAAGFGGPPIIRANSGIFRVGYRDALGVGIGGFASIEMWNEGAGGYEAIITSYSDNPGDPLDIGNGDHAMGLYGSETRPQYNGGDLALLSDVGGGETGLVIPHINAWNGTQLSMTVLNGIAVALDAGGGAEVTVGDFLRAFHNGDASPVNNPPLVRISKDEGSNWTAWNNNVWSNPIQITCAEAETTVIWIQATDGVSTDFVETYVVRQDPLGVCGP
jgi:hypothetical protein